MPKKVVFFVHSLNSGGIENYLLRFLDFEREKIDATVFCKSGEFGQLLSQYKLLNVMLVKKRISYFNLLHYFQLLNFLRANSFDSAVDFTGNFGGLVMLTSKLAGIKNRIIFFRNTSLRFTPNKFKLLVNHFFNRLVRFFSTAILANSEYAFKFFFKGDIDSRFKVIYNGINFKSTEDRVKIRRAEFNIPDSAFVIGHVGRYVEAKNHKVLIEVLRQLIEEDKNIYLVMCGKGVDDNMLKKSNIEKKNVRALGYRSDVDRILPMFNLFFFPSITEGQPNALIEAMSLGIPFVASDIEPIKETIPQNQFSNLYDSQDIVAFKEAIEDKIKNKVGIDNSLSDWAKSTYDSGENFDNFYELI